MSIFFRNRNNSIDYRVDVKDSIKELRINVLLTEYQTLSSRIEQIVQIYWQAGSIFIGTSITGLAIIGQLLMADNKSLRPFVILTISIIITATLYRWGDAADRWNSVINVFYFRIQQIERALQMFGNRMVDWADNYSSDVDETNGLGNSEEIQIIDDDTIINESKILNEISEKDTSTHKREYRFKEDILSESFIGKKLIENRFRGQVKTFRDDLVSIISLGWFFLLFISIFPKIMEISDFMTKDDENILNLIFYNPPMVYLLYLSAGAVLVIWVLFNTRGNKTNITGSGKFILLFLIILFWYLFLQQDHLPLDENYRLFIQKKILLFFTVPLSAFVKVIFGKNRI